MIEAIIIGLALICPMALIIVLIKQEHEQIIELIKLERQTGRIISRVME